MHIYIKMAINPNESEVRINGKNVKNVLEIEAHQAAGNFPKVIMTFRPDTVEIIKEERITSSEKIGSKEAVIVGDIIVSGELPPRKAIPKKRKFPKKGKDPQKENKKPLGDFDPDDIPF